MVAALLHRSAAFSCAGSLSQSSCQVPFAALPILSMLLEFVVCKIWSLLHVMNYMQGYLLLVLLIRYFWGSF